VATPRAVAPADTTSLARKALHATSTCVPIAYARFGDRQAVVVVLGVALAVALGVEGVRWHSSAARGAFERAVGGLLKTRERSGPTAATWLAASMFVAAAVLPPAPAIAVLWSVCAGDPAAAVAGTAWKSVRGTRAVRGRTLAGSLAMAIVCAAGAHLLAGYSIPASLLVGTGAATGERLGGRIDDNATIAAASALAALALS